MVIAPNTEALAGITTDPESGGPWVMWAGTPYAHIMVPVAAHGGHEMCAMCKEMHGDGEKCEMCKEMHKEHEMGECQ
jgi:hypothetical protein